MFQFSVDVDLSDHEGNVKHLLEAPAKYANEVLKGRESFVLVKVESMCMHAEML